MATIVLVVTTFTVTDVQFAMQQFCRSNIPGLAENLNWRPLKFTPDVWDAIKLLEEQGRGCSNQDFCFERQIANASRHMFDSLLQQRRPVNVPTAPGTSRKLVVYPISFSIAEELVVATCPPKSRTFGTVVPGVGETYVFSEMHADLNQSRDNENRYHEDMSRSLFAITFKKGGWDCLRHLEILAAGSFPLFTDIEKANPHMISSYPRTLLGLLLRYPSLQIDTLMTLSTVKNRPLSAWNMSLDTDSFVPDTYVAISTILLFYTRSVLTTRSMAEYLLTTIGRHPSHLASVLYLNSGGFQSGDYLCDTLLHGLKSLLGHSAVVDYPKRFPVSRNHQSFWLKDQLSEKTKLYGRGFTFGHRLYEIMGSVDRENIARRIESMSFDLIIIGDGHRGAPSLLQTICSVYRSDDIVLVYGEDSPISVNEIVALEDCVGYFFSREIEWT